MWHFKIPHYQIGHFEYKMPLYEKKKIQVIWNSAVLDPS